MLKTYRSVKRYNDNLHKTFAPELARMRKVELIAKEILTAIEAINYPGPDNCHLINAIQRILSAKTDLKETSIN